MNSIPTNNHIAPDNTYQASLPFTPHQLETQDREAPTFINDLFSNNLDFGEFNVDTSVVPRVPSHGTVPRHVNPVVRRRRLNNIRRRVLQGSISRVSSSQTTGFDALPQTNVLAAAPQLRLTFDPLDGAYIDPSTSLFAGPNSTPFDSIRQRGSRWIGYTHPASTDPVRRLQWTPTIPPTCTRYFPADY